jgi:hypothetical protein
MYSGSAKKLVAIRRPSSARIDLRCSKSCRPLVMTIDDDATAGVSGGGKNF